MIKTNIVIKRPAEDSLKKFKFIRRAESYLKVISVKGLIAGVCILAATISVVIYSHSKTSFETSSDNSVDNNNILTQTVDIPDENLPSDNYIWPGRPGEPKYIKIDSIGAAGYIVKVGVDQYRQITSPTNIYMAGWFVQSVLPGQPGLSIIDGHIGGYAKLGIFQNLADAKPGDIVTVTYGNGTERHFTILSVNIYDASVAANYLFSQDPSVTSQLNIISCGGNFSATQHTYTQRVIVTAEFISE